MYKGYAGVSVGFAHRKDPTVSPSGPWGEASQGRQGFPVSVGLSDKSQPLHLGSLKKQFSNGDLAHPIYATCLGARCDFHCIAPPNIYLKFHLLLSSWDVSFNPGLTRHTVKKWRVLCANIRGLQRNLTDLVSVATECDVLVLSEALVSTRRHSAELSVP